MSKHQRHHYVPRFYLDRWSGVDNKLGYFSWANGRLVYSRIGPKGAGVQTELYSIASATGPRRQQLETGFFTPDIDDPGALAMSKLVDDRADRLTPEEKAVFAKYLVAQQFRSPDFIAHIRAEGKQAMEGILEQNEAAYQSAKGEGHPSSLREWTQSSMAGLEDSLGVGMLPSLLSLPDAIDRICGMTWVVTDFSGSKHALLTSDRPVVFTCGIAKWKCIVALPLSPTLAFLAGNDRGYLKSVIDRDISSLAAALNQDVVRQAVLYVYCRDEAQRRFVENRMRKPDQITPPRFRGFS